MPVAVEGARDLQATARVAMARVERDGYAQLAGYSDADFLDIGRTLGAIVGDTVVRVVPGKRTYLAGTDAIPLHTDHPKADLVMWRCESQDPVDGASLLVDGYEVLGHLTDPEVEWLGKLQLPAMVRLGDPAEPTPVVSGRSGRQAVFYAPWLEPVEKLPGSLDSLASFRSRLERVAERATTVRLRIGEVLVVDNHRILHGRGRLEPASPRRLRRLWVRTS